MYRETAVFEQTFVDVGDGHRLYVERAGNPDGIPALFLHGGPGSGCEAWHRRFFNPERYHVVLFDQRGAGRSTPHAELTANTTAHLIEDIERLRQRFSVEQWLVFGGSWGSTLALAYAETHPDRVSALVLRGIFLCRQQDLAWFYQSGAGRLFPEAFAEYVAEIPEGGRIDLIGAYHARLTDPDPRVRQSAALAWSRWEGVTATLHPNSEVVNHFTDPQVALALARIENHYFVNAAFLEPNQLLRDAGRLAHIPGVIVHGRYDVICPVDQAIALHQTWPRASLEVIPDAGHSAAEPGIARALVAATDRFAAELAE
ncbi:MAG: prolyl aminopeptidase [Thioalkalivibrionaceae bacterium]